MSRIREKLPELLLEAVSVVFAVVIALGVDEWWEDRENLEMAGRALDAIVAEVQDNRDELLEGREANEALLERAVRVASADTVVEDLTLGYQYALLSEAGWETARVTQSTHYIPLATVQRITQVYAMQQLFRTSQDQVLQVILNESPSDPASAVQLAKRLVTPLSIAQGLEQTLVMSYDSLLVHLGGER